MILHQLSFDFNVPVSIPTDVRHRRSWRVRGLARRYHIPHSQAAVYASEMLSPADAR
jgi:hypothetical protein